MALTAAWASSCVVPLATAEQNCVSYCTLLQGCGIPTTSDCNGWCTAYKTEAQHAGCEAQFDAATACYAGDSTCEAGATCASQTADFTTCTQQFCAANPTDAVCPSAG